MSEDIIELLRAADAPTMSLDPYAVVTGGRRRRRNRIVAQVGIGVAALAAVAVTVTTFSTLGRDGATTLPNVPGTGTSTSSTTLVDGLFWVDLPLAVDGQGTSIPFRAAAEGVTGGDWLVHFVSLSPATGGSPTPRADLLFSPTSEQDSPGALINGSGSDSGFIYLVTPTRPTALHVTPVDTSGPLAGLKWAAAKVPGIDAWATVIHVPAFEDGMGHYFALNWTSPTGATTEAGLARTPLPSGGSTELPGSFIMNLKPADPASTRNPLRIRVTPDPANPGGPVTFESNGNAPSANEFMGGQQVTPPTSSTGAFQLGDGADYGGVYGLTAGQPMNITVEWPTTSGQSNTFTTAVQQIPGTDLWAVAIDRNPVTDGGTTAVTKLTWTDPTGAKHTWTPPKQ